MINRAEHTTESGNERARQMDTAYNRANLRWKFTAFALILVLCLLSGFIPGNGVQARLDLTQGLRSQSFYASRTAAAALLTEPQRSVLAWATIRRDGEQAPPAYGARPTVRTFVMGEILRAADHDRDIMKQMQARLDAMDPKAVQASRDAFIAAQQKRKDGLKIFDAFAPRIMGLEKETVDGRNYAVVKYNLQLPEGLSLRFLPCALEFSDKDSVLKGKLEFDCLFMPSIGNAYRARVLLPEDFDIARLDVKLSVEFGRAIVEKRSDQFAAIDAVQESIPELRTLRETQRQMKDALDKKVYF